MASTRSRVGCLLPPPKPARKAACGYVPAGDSKWSTIKLGELEASNCELAPVPESEFEWRIYVVERGEYYHLIILHVSKVALESDGEFYENVVRSFETEL